MHRMHGLVRFRVRDSRVSAILPGRIGLARVESCNWLAGMRMSFGDVLERIRLGRVAGGAVGIIWVVRLFIAGGVWFERGGCGYEEVSCNGGCGLVVCLLPGACRVWWLVELECGFRVGQHKRFGIHERIRIGCQHIGQRFKCCCFGSIGQRVGCVGCRIRRGKPRAEGGWRCVGRSGRRRGRLRRKSEGSRRLQRGQS